MGFKNYRNYDPQIVTNKFAIDECIEWAQELCMEEDRSIGCYCIAGIIRKITPYTVLVQLLSSGKEIRIDKGFLAQGVIDIGLEESIKASIGQDTSKKSPKNDIPHDAYRLRDPRDKSIFYVGISKNAQRRFKQHLSCSGLNFKLNIRIQEIIQSGLIPEMEIIEKSIAGTKKAMEREKFWIYHHAQLGNQLTNIAEMCEATI